VDRYSSLATALESEVLTEMADTFFGARKNLDDLTEAFMLHVEVLRGLAAKVLSRLSFLRSLLLDPEGESAFFAALGVAPQFPQPTPQHGLRGWRPDHLPFALLPSSRYVGALLLAYTELAHACEVYLHGEYEDDPESKGRKRLSLNFALLESQCRLLNKRIEKLNGDMAPSSVLQYARNISMEEQPGQGAITNALGAESLDKGLMYHPVDFASLGLWRAPSLPKPEECNKALTAFARAFYASNTEKVRRVLADL